MSQEADDNADSVIATALNFPIKENDKLLTPDFPYLQYDKMWGIDKNENRYYTSSDYSRGIDLDISFDKGNFYLKNSAYYSPSETSSSHDSADNRNIYFNMEIGEKKKNIFKKFS